MGSVALWQKAPEFVGDDGGADGVLSSRPTLTWGVGSAWRRDDCGGEGLADRAAAAEERQVANLPLGCAAAAGRRDGLPDRSMQRVGDRSDLGYASPSP